MVGRPRNAQRLEQRGEQRVKIHTAATRFLVDESRKPSGMTYEWKRQTVFGQEDVEHQVNLEQNYWTPVPGSRHPELTGSRGGDRPIVRGGLMLMERAEEITQEARELDDFAARNQEAQEMARHGNARKLGRGIKKTYENVAAHDPGVVADD